MTSPPKAQPTASFMSPAPHALTPHELSVNAPKVEPEAEVSAPEQPMSAQGVMSARGVRDLFEPAYALLDPEALDLHELMDDEEDFTGGADTGVEELTFEPSAWEDDLLTAEELENLFVSPPDAPPPPLELIQLFEERAHIEPPPQLSSAHNEPPLSDFRRHAPQSLSPRSLSDHPIFTTQDTPSPPSSERYEPPDHSTHERSPLSSTLQLGDEHAQTLDEPLDEPLDGPLSEREPLFEREPLSSPSASLDPHPMSVEPSQLTQELSEGLLSAPREPSDRQAPLSPPPPTLKRGGSVTPPHVRVIALMGAQGGVGTSLIATNLAVCLARLGERVGLADLNPSGSNLHTLLGLEPMVSQPSDLLRLTPTPRLQEVTWSDSVSPPQSFEGERSAFSDSEPHNDQQKRSALGEGRLWLAQPATSLMGVSPPEHRLKALELLAQRDATLWVLDLGHHQDALTLTRFHEADVSVVVLEPQLSAIERAHHLTRAALFHNILGHADDASIIARAMLMADHVGELNTPIALLASLERVNPEAAEVMRKRLSSFTPQLLLNKCRTHSDRDLTLDLSAVIQRKWRLSTCPLGAIDYDENLMKRSLQRAERPLALERVSSPLKSELERLSKRIYKQVRTQETT